MQAEKGKAGGIVERIDPPRLWDSGKDMFIENEK